MEPTALIPLLVSAAIQTSSLPWLNAPPVLREGDRSQAVSPYTRFTTSAN